MSKCLVMANRPKDVIYFYNLWNKGFIPLQESIDFLICQPYLDLVERTKVIFNLPIGKVYTFEEPLPTYYKNKNLVRNFFRYCKIIGRFKSISLADYRYVLTFDDSMLHHQFLISRFKKEHNANGLVFLADEGLILYDRDTKRQLGFTRRMAKKMIFPKYVPLQTGLNPLVDIIFARLPEKCNCSNPDQVKKVDYRIAEEDLSKWHEVFGVDGETLENLREISGNTILFLGTPFQLFGISYDEIINFLFSMKEFEASDIIVKPHPMEDSSPYKVYFDVLPAHIPAEILMMGIKFKFVLGYSSSALIEASLYGQKTYYLNLKLPEKFCDYERQSRFMSDVIFPVFSIHPYNLIDGP